MGYNTKRHVIIVPAAKVAEFNAFMEQNGYGPNSLVIRDDNQIGATADAKEKPPTHYSLEIASADDGIIAAAKKALAKCNDKLPAKEKGLDQTQLKVPELVLKDGSKPPVSRPIITAETLAESAGWKKKSDLVKRDDDTPIDERG